MTDLEANNYLAIQRFLVETVPDEMREIAARGGISDRDLAWLQQPINDDPNDERPLNILMRADHYLLYPSNKKVFLRSLLIFRKVIAIMGFHPGGVRVFGWRFDAEIDGFIRNENS